MNRALILAATLTVAATPAFASDDVGIAGIIGGLILIGLLFGGYFLPTIIAMIRSHPNVVAIGLLNLFLGWTAIGWVGALVWAVISIASRERVVYVETERRPPTFIDHQ